MDVDVVAFTFQQSSVGVFMAVFAGWSEFGSFLLVAYEVVGMRREGDEAGYIQI